MTILKIPIIGESIVKSYSSSLVDCDLCPPTRAECVVTVVVHMGL